MLALLPLIRLTTFSTSRASRGFKIQGGTFVSTVSFRIEPDRSDPEIRAPDKTFADKFLPEKLHCLKSSSLSLTAFACKEGSEYYSNPS